MSDHVEEPTDQSEEMFKDLLQAERDQEITQTTTLQGQIVSLILILRDLGVLDKKQIDAWESMSEHVTDMLFKMAKANEAQASDNVEDPEDQLEIMLEGAEATIEFTRLMGNTDKALAPMIAQRDNLARALEVLRSEP
jgi:hypothetical protein